MRFCGGGFDSFLGFEYGVVITLASHVFEYFFRFFLRACVICAFFGFVGVTWCDTPTFSGLPSRFPDVRSLCWVFRLLWRSSELQLRWRRSPRRYSADSSASLAQCGFVGGFFPNFAIFALVSDHLRNFCFYSWASLLVLPSLLRLPILLSLSPLVTSLRGLGCSPPSLVVPVVFALGEFYFCSSGAVSSSSSCSG